MRNVQTEDTGLQKFITWQKQVTEASGSHSNYLHCGFYIAFLKTFSITGNACTMAKAFFNHRNVNWGGQLHYYGMESSYFSYSFIHLDKL